jgi:outer membrane murein-binding lipoprotein Lpp
MVEILMEKRVRVSVHLIIHYHYISDNSLASKISDNNDTSEKTAIKFNAEAHVQLIQTAFANLHNNAKDFTIAQIANSTAVNPKIARMMGWKNVACHNHMLNLASQKMDEMSSEIHDISTKTQNLHRKVGASNCLSAQLENIQAGSQALSDDMRPRFGKLKLQSKTCWNARFDLLQNHLIH